MAREWGTSGDKIVTGLSAHSTQRTIALWAWRDGAGGGGSGRYFDKRGDANEVELLTFNGSSPAYEHYWTTTKGGWSIPDPGTGAWHHFAVVYDRGATTNDPAIYVDGSLQSETEYSAPAGTLVTNALPYIIGNRNDGADRTHDGRLAEWAVWDALLDAADVAALADGFSPLLIRPANLASYIPVSGRLSPEPDWMIGGGATVSGTVFADPPRILLPRGMDIGVEIPAVVANKPKTLMLLGVG